MSEFVPEVQLRAADPKVVAGFHKASDERAASDLLRVSLFAAGIVEANLRNPAGGDRDSVGSLQQRGGWGSLSARMDPRRAALAFLADAQQRVLPRTPNLEPGPLAQAVQRSAFPDRYADAVPAARHIITKTRGNIVAQWHLAPSLVTLQKDLDVKFGANRPNDGTIGDASHAARPSEHNPDRDRDGMPTGAVSAIDVYTSSGGKTWISAAEFTKLLASLKKDSRVWYVIHKGYIYSRTNDFAKEEYTDLNPHSNHIHISLMQTKAAHDSRAQWLDGPVVKPDPKPDPKPAEPGGGKFADYDNVPGSRVLRQGAEGDDVAFLQRWLGAKDDGVFGRLTFKAAKNYQGERGLVKDGIVGPKTWAEILNKGAS